MQNPDHSSRVEARKNQTDPIIMYLIVRESLEMSIGKTAAQVGHAVGMLYQKFSDYDIEAESYLPLIHEQSSFSIDLIPKELLTKINLWDNWVNNSFRKVVLKADDKEWKKIKEQLTDYVLVVDAGLTEIESGSETVIGLWPMYKSQAPKLVSRLQVLK